MVELGEGGEGMRKGGERFGEGRWGWEKKGEWVGRGLALVSSPFFWRR